MDRLRADEGGRRERMALRTIVDDAFRYADLAWTSTKIERELARLDGALAARAQPFSLSQLAYRVLAIGHRLRSLF